MTNPTTEMAEAVLHDALGSSTKRVTPDMVLFAYAALNIRPLRRAWCELIGLKSEGRHILSACPMTALGLSVGLGEEQVASTDFALMMPLLTHATGLSHEYAAGLMTAWDGWQDEWGTEGRSDDWIAGLQDGQAILEAVAQRYGPPPDWTHEPHRLKESGHVLQQG